MGKTAEVTVALRIADAGHREARRVCHVEVFVPELKAKALSDLEVFEQREVKITNTGAVLGLVADIAVGAGSRGLDGCNVPPLIRRTATARSLEWIISVDSRGAS